MPKKKRKDSSTSISPDVKASNEIDDWEDVPIDDWEDVPVEPEEEPGIIEFSQFPKIAAKGVELLGGAVAGTAGAIAEPTLGALSTIDPITGAPLRAAMGKHVLEGKPEESVGAFLSQLGAGAADILGLGKSDTAPEVPTGADIIRPRLPEGANKEIMAQILGGGLEGAADLTGFIPSSLIFKAGRGLKAAGKAAQMGAAKGISHAGEYMTNVKHTDFTARDAMKMFKESRTDRILFPGYHLKRTGKAVNEYRYGALKSEPTRIDGTGEYLARRIREFEDTIEEAADMGSGPAKKVIKRMKNLAYPPMTPDEKVWKMLDIDPGLLDEAMAIDAAKGALKRDIEFASKAVSDRNRSLNESLEFLLEDHPEVKADVLEAFNKMSNQPGLVNMSDFKDLLSKVKDLDAVESLIKKLDAESAQAASAINDNVMAIAAQQSDLARREKLLNLKAQTLWEENKIPQNITLFELDTVVRAIDKLKRTPKGHQRALAFELHAVAAKSRANLNELFNALPEGKVFKELKHQHHLNKIADVKRSGLMESAGRSMTAGGVAVAMGDPTNMMGTMMAVAGASMVPKTFNVMLGMVKAPEDLAKLMMSAIRSERLGLMEKAFVRFIETNPVKAERLGRLMVMAGSKPTLQDAIFPEEMEKLGNIREYDPETVAQEAMRLEQDDTISEVERAKKLNYINKHGYFISDEKPVEIDEGPMDSSISIPPDIGALRQRIEGDTDVSPVPPSFEKKALEVY